MEFQVVLTKLNAEKTLKKGKASYLTYNKYYLVLIRQTEKGENVLGITIFIITINYMRLTS